MREISDLIASFKAGKKEEKSEETQQQETL
jgi:hypothetical protein